jgi:hypothetical protein
MGKTNACILIHRLPRKNPLKRSRWAHDTKMGSKVIDYGMLVDLNLLEVEYSVRLCSDSNELSNSIYSSWSTGSS